MEINWWIIGIVLAGVVCLIIFLIRKNLKDQQKVSQHFDDQYRDLSEESEPNDD